MSESFKDVRLAPPVVKPPTPAFAVAIQEVPGVPAGAKQYLGVSKQAAQGSLQHKRAHMHKDKAGQR